MAGAPGGMQFFHGEVKSFDPNKGYGFVDTPETRQLYGKDIFLSQAVLQAAGFDTTVRANVVRQKIRFGITHGRGGKPEGASVSRVFRGVVKSFDPAKRYGFVTSPESQAAFGKDIFAAGERLAAAGMDVQNRRDVVGRSVYFLVVTGTSGKPEADNITIDDGSGQTPTITAAPSSRAAPAVGWHADGAGPPARPVPDRGTGAKRPRLDPPASSDTSDEWEKHESDEHGGRSYWYNTRTGESTWVPPKPQLPALMPARPPPPRLPPPRRESTPPPWQECASEEHGGRTFWYNTVTHESVWVRPW
eukprot:TRINITY_DN28176_c0_g1_i1.p1 TRINITY_DN28176_c0_g1~~TRINITY_DN28176_c0_g1_i1.p1  ORF type:complete len:304 (+),score=60.58 TRINITY_DN28176_c0_g1_i1:96-1007(+)